MIKGGLTMTKDKSLLYYGAIYHRLFDPPLAEARQITVDLIAEGTGDDGVVVVDRDPGGGHADVDPLKGGSRSPRT